MSWTVSDRPAIHRTCVPSNAWSNGMAERRWAFCSPGDHRLPTRSGCRDQYRTADRSRRSSRSDLSSVHRSLDLRRRVLLGFRGHGRAGRGSRAASVRSRPSSSRLARRAAPARRRGRVRRPLGRRVACTARVPAGPGSRVGRCCGSGHSGNGSRARRCGQPTRRGCSAAADGRGAARPRRVPALIGRGTALGRLERGVGDGVAPSVRNGTVP